MIDIGVIDKIIAIVFSLAILANGYLVGKRVKTFLFPACIFAFFWFAYTFFPLVFLPDVTINPVSIIFIFICTLAFSITSLFFKWELAFEKNRLKLQLPATYLHNNFLLRSIKVMFYVIFFCLIMDLKLQGFNLGSFISNFYEASNNYMIKRYTQEIVQNVFAQASNILNYALVILGGLLVGYCDMTYLKKVKLTAYALIPSVLITLFQSAKGTILLAVVLFYGGVLIARIFKNNLELTNKKTNKAFLITIALLVVIMFFSFMSRGLYNASSSEVKDRLLYYFNSYSFGHIYAFSDWFSFYLFNESVVQYNHEDLYYGFYTFMAFFKLFGDKTVVPPGVFDEYLYHKDFATNIYTVFRGNILDFGVAGTIFFWFIAGIVCNHIFYKLLIKQKPIINISLFAMMIGYFYTSFIISLFIWKSIFGAVFILSIIFLYNKFLFKQKQWS